MFEVIGIEKETLIIVGSAIAAALSFVIFAFPFLQRSEQRERYRSVIKKKRKDLIQQTHEDLKSKGGQTSARDSVAALYKMQKLTGDLGEKLRVQLLQAGIRSPTAPIKFLLAQIILPVLFCIMAIIFLSAGEEEYSSLVRLMILAGAAGSGYFLPRVLLKNTAIKRQQEFSIYFPDALDMMLICVQGGISLEQTIDKVAEEVVEHCPMLAEELGLLSAEMGMLNDRRVALSEFGKRVGGMGKTFASSLIQAEQYGTSMSQALRIMAGELRDVRMSEAERKAASLPPKLTVPMILFFLPSLFIVILGPAILQATAAGL